MGSVVARKNKAGEITGWKFMVCVGRDDNYRQIWRIKNVPRLDLTPAAERKKLRQQCDEWAQEQKEEYDRSHDKKDKTKTTLTVFIREHWFPDHVQNGKHTPASVDAYRRSSADIMAYFTDKKRLNEIDPESIKRYVNYLTTEARTDTGKPYSAATVQARYKTLRNIIRYAIRMKYIKATDDPFQWLAPEDKPYTPKQTVDFLTPEEAKEFMSCLESEPLFWKCLITVLIVCGLRRGECVGLQWRDLDAGKLTLTVNRNVTADKGAAEKVHVGPPKTKESQRSVPITPRLNELLMEYRQEQAGKYKDALTEESFIFCAASSPEKPLYPSTPTLWLRRFCKRYNLRDVSPHDLRHSAASLAMMSGADLKAVQTLLGHADPETTMRFYIGFSEETQRRTVSGIESLIYNDGK